MSDKNLLLLNGMNPTEKEFNNFLEKFIPLLAHKEKTLQETSWQIYNNESEETKKAYADALFEYKLTFTDRLAFEELLRYQHSKKINDQLLNRQLTELIRQFRRALLPADLIKEMSDTEAELESTFSKFRPKLNGKEITDNDILDILAKEKDVSLRKQTWEASKQVGLAMAPLGLKMVALRNKAAKILGYDNYFEMSYSLDELDIPTVFSFFDQQLTKSETIWHETKKEIDKELALKFSVDESDIGPWAWSDPFCQDDPLGNSEAKDEILKNRDVIDDVTKFYDSLGFDIRPVLARSDLYERPNKNPHAFCFPMDRAKDIRILANVKPDWYWFDTMFHESGHAVHDLFHNQDLPWLLRTCSHTITTEAAAGITEYYAYDTQTLKALLELPDDSLPTLNAITQSYKRTQIIFSRWGNVITRFEKELYENPDQNLQDLWWSLVERYQGIKRPAGREDAADWASKVHVTTGPCYYQNYLLAYVMAAQIRAKLKEVTNNETILNQKTAGDFLKNNFFALGNTYPWYELIEKITGKPLQVDAWLKEIS